MNAIETIKRLDELFTDSTWHTRGAYARTGGGVICDIANPEAVCWCLVGGVCKVLGSRDPADDLWTDLRTLLKVPYPMGVTNWNDEVGFEGVKAAIRNALEREAAT